MRYFVIIRRTLTGYSADVPDLPGCVATGRTVERTRQRIGEAMTSHVDLMRESGEKIPSPRKRLEINLEDEESEEFCTWVEIKDKSGRRLLRR